MVIPNDFLINIQVHNENDIMRGCFCGNCRNLRVLRCSRHSSAQLFRLFHDLLPAKSDSRLDKYHESVLDLVVSGHVYKESCLENTGYVKFKSWAKKQAVFADWAPND